jgi:hypothetical protein
MKLTTSPTFKRQSDDTPVSEFALRLVVQYPDGETHPIGTGTVVLGHLVLTAKHNLDDIVERFGARQTNEGLEVGEYAVRLIQIMPGPRYVIWNVFSAWMSAESDLALLHLGLSGQSAPEQPIVWRQPPIRALPPRAGSVVAAFGYHSSLTKTTRNEDGSYHLDLRDEPATATGVIEEILPQGQPAGRFTFPCYRVAARFDAGMSGGPVFDEMGCLCGIISGTYGVTDDKPLSYVAMLWPMLRMLISENRPHPHAQNVSYPVIDLALMGLLFVVDLSDLDPAQFPGRQLPARK